MRNDLKLKNIEMGIFKLNILDKIKNNNFTKSFELLH